VVDPERDRVPRSAARVGGSSNKEAGNEDEATGAHAEVVTVDIAMEDIDRISLNLNIFRLH
jgi:hypothetical protein